MFNSLRSAAVLAVAAIALAQCGGTPPAPAPEAPPAPKSEAIARADALIADLKKREAASQQPTTSRSPVDVISSSYTVTGRDKSSWRFSWKMSVRNQARTPIRVRAEMDFRDSKGVLISTAEETLTIGGSSVAEVAGFTVIKATDGPRVASATPRVVLLKSS